MFNMYQNINRKESQEDKELNFTGHDRFCQERLSRRGRKKKRPPRRTRSAAEFPSATLDAASKRASFSKRSHSSEQKSENAISKLKLLSGLRRSSSATRHEYSALKPEPGSERHKFEKYIRDGAFSTCKRFLEDNQRYELRSQLGNLGSRSDKHWFIIYDTNLGAERLLTVLPLPKLCPIKPTEVTRDTVMDLFRGLQHPYIHPVLDIEFWDFQVAFVSPLNNTGSLRDFIYGCVWHDDFEKKYTSNGQGLPFWQIQRLGRQILEALFFLRERNFPPFYHLHSGNVILQNGVARLAGLENSLLGLPPRPPSVLADTLGFGHVLFEMAAGYELPTPPTPAHLQLELERVPKVADTLHLIFQTPEPPTLEELLCSDLFRGVELRELRGTSSKQVRASNEVQELLEIVRCPVPPSPIRRFQLSDDFEPWFA